MDQTSLDFDADSTFHPTNAAKLRQWLPWLRLFRAGWMAIDYQKMFVATLAVFAMAMLNHGAFLVFSVKSDPSDPYLFSYVEIHEAGYWMIQDLIPFFVESEDQIRSFEFDPDDWFAMALHLRPTITFPFTSLLYSLIGMASDTTSMSWLGSIYFIIGLVISALLGGTISRMAALELTGNDRSLIRDSKYALRRLPIMILSPLVTFLILTFFWLMNFGIGLVGRIPYVGEVFVAVGWGLMVLIGVVMALVLIGLLIGWPLMFASSVIERDDPFDPFSRAFSYLGNRPVYACFLIAIACLFGEFLLPIFEWILKLGCALTWSSVGSGMGQETIFLQTPSLLEYREQCAELCESGLALSVMRFWMGIVGLLPLAFAFSYFWTSTAIVYMLLRQSEDGTPLHVIDLSDRTNTAHADLPLVGIPAAEQREAKRTAENQVTQGPSDSNETTESQ